MEGDLLFFSVNNFIKKVKCIFSEPQKDKDLDDKDYIDVNENFNQENTLKNFYNIYNKEIEKENENFHNIEKEYNLEKKIILYTNLETKILKKTIFKFFLKIFFYIFLIRVVNVSSDFFSPIILGKILGITTNTTKNLDLYEKKFCYFLIGFFIISNLTRILTSMIFNYNLNLIRNQIEIIVNNLIFNKILVISQKSKNLEAKITKFVNDDISIFFGFFINLNRSWELPIEIILAIYGTYMQVSVAFLPGLLFAVILLYINYKIALSITSTNEELYKVRLDRQDLEILALKNVKSIKFEFLENFFIKKIFVNFYHFFNFSKIFFRIIGK